MLKLMDFMLELMDFMLKLIDFMLKLMVSYLRLLTMSDFILQLMDVCTHLQGGQAGRAARSIALTLMNFVFEMINLH